MSAAILDRARAFEMIAAHLSEEKRTEIADAIGARLLAEIQPTGAKPKQPTTAAPVKETAEELKWKHATDFLKGKGYADADLARAAGRLAAWLKSDVYPHLTLDARMQTWWATQREGKPE